MHFFFTQKKETWKLDEDHNWCEDQDDHSDGHDKKGHSRSRRKFGNSQKKVKRELFFIHLYDLLLLGSLPPSPFPPSGKFIHQTTSSEQS